MPCPGFYFSTDTGSGQSDDEGVDLPDEQAAQDAAQVELADMAKAALPNGKHSEFAVDVADQNHEHLYSAKLTVDGHSAVEDRVAQDESDKAADDAAVAVRNLIDSR